MQGYEGGTLDTFLSTRANPRLVTLSNELTSHPPATDARNLDLQFETSDQVNDASSAEDWIQAKAQKTVGTRRVADVASIPVEGPIESSPIHIRPHRR